MLPRSMVSGLVWASLLAGCGDAPMAPAPALGVGEGLALAVGTEHSCVLHGSGQVSCWGWGRLGQLGDGDTLDRSTPVPVLQGALRFSAISAGGNHTCALTSDGRAYCWGAAFAGELGNGVTAGRVTTPAAVLGGLRFRAVSAGDGHTCALATDGEAYCWGTGKQGQLGAGTTESAAAPIAVNTPLRFRTLSAGLEFACGVADSRRAYCWGSNVWGQLGSGTVGGQSALPLPVTGGLAFDSVVVGETFACGLTGSLAAYCWGLSSFGRLGDGGGADSIIPRPVPVAGALAFRRLSIGADHACAVTAPGEAYCWGINTYGKLGNPGPPASDVPSLVEGGLDFVWIGSGLNHNCGISRTGRGYCWGRNSVGQLGRRAPPWSSALPLEFPLD